MAGEVQDSVEANRLFESLGSPPLDPPLACDADVSLTDGAGRTPLHYAAAAGHDDAIEELLKQASADATIADSSGDTALHLAAQAGLPMATYLVSCHAPSACLLANHAGQTPIDLCSKGEVLNAMLLACAGDAGEPALDAMRRLLDRGTASAVPDTWAPNGSSALMLAAAVDSTDGCALLLANGATLELQDALGRTALMFAAGNNAARALVALLDAGASVSVRDRRGKNVMAFAQEGSECRSILEARLAEMESKAAKLQAELLAELLGEEAKDGSSSSSKASGSAKPSKPSKKKGKAGKAAKKAAAAAATAQPVAQQQRQHSSVAASPMALAEPHSAARAAAAEEKAAEPEVTVTVAPVMGTLVAQSEEPASVAPATEAALQQDAPGAANITAAAAAEAAAETAALLPSCPPSPGGPEWTVVGSKGKPCAKMGQPVADAGPAAAPAAGKMRRNGSNTSLASTCSWESHETGSERSVLRQTHSRSNSRVVVVPVPHKATATAAKPATAALAPELGDVAFPPLVATTARAAAEPAGSVHQSHAADTDGSPALQLQTSQQLATASPAAIAAAAAVSAPEYRDAQAAAPAALEAEVTCLRSEVAQLRRQLGSLELQHKQELAAVLDDARATLERERQAKVYQVAAFLQNNASALLNILPEVLRVGAPTGGAPATAAPGLVNPLDLLGSGCLLGGSGGSGVGSGGLLGLEACAGAVSSALRLEPLGLSRYQQPVAGSGCATPAAELDFSSICTPLSSSPVEFTLQGLDKLRGEYSGANAFLVPASAEAL